MDATKDYLHTKWFELKPKLRKRWVKITEDDIVRINGNTDELIRTLRRRYGYGQAQAEIEIDQWLVSQAGD